MQSDSIDKNILSDTEGSALMTDQSSKKMMDKITTAQAIFLGVVATILVLTATLGLTLGYIFGCVPAFALVLLPIGPIVALFCLSIYLYKKKSLLLSKTTTPKIPEPTDDSTKKPVSTQGPELPPTQTQQPAPRSIDPTIEDLDPLALDPEEYLPVHTPPPSDSEEYGPPASPFVSPLDEEGFPVIDPSALEDIVSPFGPEGGTINLDDSGAPFIIPPDIDVPPSPIPGTSTSPAPSTVLPSPSLGTSASPTPSDDGFPVIDPFALEDIVSPFGPEGGTINLDDSGRPFVIPPDVDVPPSPIPGTSASPAPSTVPPASTSPAPSTVPPASTSPVPPLIPTPSVNPAPSTVPPASASPDLPVIAQPFVLTPGQLPQSPAELVRQVEHILGDNCWKVTLQNVERRVYGERTRNDSTLQIFCYNPYRLTSDRRGRRVSFLQGIILSHHTDGRVPNQTGYKLPPMNGDKTAFIFTSNSEHPATPDQPARSAPAVTISRFTLPNRDPAMSDSELSCYDLTGVPPNTISSSWTPGFCYFAQLTAPGTEDQPLCAVYAYIYYRYLDIFKNLLEPRLLHPGIEHLAMNIEALDFPDTNTRAAAEGLSYNDTLDLENNLPYAACLQALIDSQILETSSLVSDGGLIVHLLLNIVNFTSV